MWKWKCSEMKDEGSWIKLTLIKRKTLTARKHTDILFFYTEMVYFYVFLYRVHI